MLNGSEDHVEVHHAGRSAEGVKCEVRVQKGSLTSQMMIFSVMS